MLVADLRRDYVNTWFTPLADASFPEMEKLFTEMEKKGREGINHAHVKLTDVTVTRGADMRYVGQEHAVTVDLPLALFKNQDRDGIKKHFDAIHEVRYGYMSPGERAEIVSLRCAVSGLMRKPATETIPGGGDTGLEGAFRGKRPVYFAESASYVDTPTYQRRKLHAGNRVAGPVLIEEYASTTVVHPGDAVTVDAIGNLVIDIRRGS
jgi:N-methylhydantoinase A